MSLLTIIEFPSSSDDSPTTISTLKSTLESLPTPLKPLHYHISTHIAPPSPTQLTLEYPVQPSKDQETTLLSTLATSQSISPSTVSISHIPLINPTSPFTPPFSPASTSPLSTPVTEFVLSYFPTTTVTPTFRTTILSSFLHFNTLATASPAPTGDQGLLAGWIENGPSHPDIDDSEGKTVATTCFLVVRGWDSMKAYQEFVGREEFGKEYLPILLGWEAPFRMVSF